MEAVGCGRDLREPSPSPMNGWMQDTVNIDEAKLHCPICAHPLKPPISRSGRFTRTPSNSSLVLCILFEQFELVQCAAAGHLACGACHGQLADKDRCYRCAYLGGYSRSVALEDLIRSHHRAERPDAAHCRCSEPGCAFFGSPAWFIYHLRATHSWPLHSIDYGKAYRLQLPASNPRCVLVEKEDMSAFLVSVAALHGRVSLVCLRPNAAAWPHYTCKMWAATGKVPTVSVEMEVPSSAVAPATETQGKVALVAPHGPYEEEELHLNVRIDKVQT